MSLVSTSERGRDRDFRMDEIKLIFFFFHYVTETEYQ